MPKQDDKTVIWITGHSSAGKTTVALRLQHLLKEQNANCIFLDGDDLRTILSEKFGYSRTERLELEVIHSVGKPPFITGFCGSNLGCGHV